MVMPTRAGWPEAWMVGGGGWLLFHQSDGLVGWNIGCAGIRAGGLHRRVADEQDGVANQLGAAIGRGGVPFILDGRANRIDRSLQCRDA